VVYIFIVDSEAMINLSDQHQVELAQTREQVAEECRSRARSDAVNYEQMIAELQLNILIAETVCVFFFVYSFIRQGWLQMSSVITSLRFRSCRENH